MKIEPNSQLPAPNPESNSVVLTTEQESTTIVKEGKNEPEEE